MILNYSSPKKAFLLGTFLYVLLALTIVALSGCSTEIQQQEAQPCYNNTITQVVYQNKECPAYSNDTENLKNLIQCQAQLMTKNEQGLTQDYYINKLRVFRNKSDYLYNLTNITIETLNNFSAYEYNKTQKKKLTSLQSQLNYYRERIKEMSNQ